MNVIVSRVFLVMSLWCVRVYRSSIPGQQANCWLFAAFYGQFYTSYVPRRLGLTGADVLFSALLVLGARMDRACIVLVVSPR